MALAVAAALIVFAACGVLLYYAAASVDRITETRETRLLERSISHTLARLKDDVASVAVWSEAYDATARKYDPEFAQVNFGDYFFQYMRHDVSFVLDGRDRTIYAAVAGKAVDPAEVRKLVAASDRLVAAVRAGEAERLRRAPGSLGFDRVATIQAAVPLGGDVYFLCASTIVPEPEYGKALLPGPEPVVVSGFKVGPKYLAELDHDLGLHAARLLPAGTDAQPAVRVSAADGSPVAAIAWTPERPGAGVYRDAGAPIVFVGVAVLGVVAFLIYWLGRLAAQVAHDRDRAEAGDRAKSEFIANISHEIRTPLNGVLGMAQVMAAHDLAPDQRERLKVMRESGATLLALLNELLDFAKIEAGRLDLAEAPFDLERLVHEVAATFEGIAEQKGVLLSARVSPEAGGAWMGDSLRLRQVLSNLVANAVKFTDAGAVTLDATADDEGLRLSVTDTGIGIAEDQLPRLFEKFRQADASTTRRYGGTGLGLAIVRALVDMMDGAVSVESRAGEGTRFELRLPLARAAATPAAEARDEAPATAAAAPLRILAAEDNPTNQLVLRALLGPLAPELTIVDNGADAVAAYAGGGFDVILMDVQMPGMNGLDAARAIRAREAAEGRKATPILALTANVMSHQVAAYLEAGMNGHIPKPVDIASLYGALEAVTSAPADAELAA